MSNLDSMSPWQASAIATPNPFPPADIPDCLYLFTHIFNENLKNLRASLLIEIREIYFFGRWYRFVMKFFIWSSRLLK